jgi:hypothetical protein
MASLIIFLEARDEKGEPSVVSSIKTQVSRFLGQEAKRNEARGKMQEPR